MRSYRTLSRLVRTLRRPLHQDILRSELHQSFSMLLERDVQNNQLSLAPLLGKVLLLLVAFTLPAGIRAEEELTKTLKRFCQQVGKVDDNLAEGEGNWQELTEEQERSLWENL